MCMIKIHASQFEHNRTLIIIIIMDEWRSHGSAACESNKHTILKDSGLNFILHGYVNERARLYGKWIRMSFSFLNAFCCFHTVDWETNWKAETLPRRQKFVDTSRCQPRSTQYSCKCNLRCINLIKSDILSNGWWLIYPPEAFEIYPTIWWITNDFVGVI